ncbi:MAG: cytochrome bc complex cytochrome b subunit [Armatimonadota bacterium]|nr:cytochrome bc complex cytochrome b subunit [Armatimonadota bacterium]MDR5704191.1 cytochrome bc complex cytochrome b subunit [Armatimonadota bacterium]
MAEERYGTWQRWSEERLRLRAIVEFLRHKTVPIHRYSFVYYFGSITLFLFLVQVITGILLLLYYRPSADAAYESVQFIMSKVRFGWLIRSIHSWSANLMVGWVFVHMFSTLFYRAYRRPREFTWVSGALMLFLTLAFAFTGYLLPWNKLAFFATKVGTEIAGDVPLVGKYVMLLLRGGEDVTEATLSRFFGIHVAILPALATVILGIHLALVQVHGMSRPISVRAEREIPFYPDFLLRDLAVWILVLALLGTLATLYPWPLGEKADPLAPAPPGIKPEWYFLFMFQTLKFLPSKIFLFEGEMVGIMAFLVGGLVLLLVPFLDVWAQREQQNRWVTTLGILAVAYLVIMTILGLALPAM